MSTQKELGCNEYNELTRRQFISRTGTTLAVASLVPAWMPKAAFAADYQSGRDVVVSIYLRGGADGLTLCVPYGDAGYYSSRTNIAVPVPGSGADGCTDLNGFFGLAPAMSPLIDAYTADQLLVVHATGSPDPSRSHFDAMRYMEVGKPADPTIGEGWLAKHLLSSAPTAPKAPLRAMSITYGLPTTLKGGPKTLPIPNPTTFGLTGAAATRPARTAALSTIYNDADEPLKAAGLDSLNTISMLQAINFNAYVPSGGAVYPVTGFGTAIKQTAALVRADVGVEAVHIDVGGWDTHATQGVFTGGAMFNLMDSLARGVRAFHADMTGAGRINSVTLVVMSEFGRNVRENQSMGTDHGHGNCIIVMGGHVNGGQVFSRTTGGGAGWPGCAAGQLYQNQDLHVTTDWRDVLAELVTKRLANNNLAYIFPDYTPTTHNLFT